MDPNISARRSAACVLAVLAGLVGGCGRSRTGPSLVVERNDTPEAQLKNAMRRLNHALGSASADSGSGVVSKRRCTFKLIEPEAEGGDYKADVTIETATQVDASVVIPKKQEPAKGNGKIVPISDIAAAAKAAADVDKRSYHLTYKNHRWELDGPPPEDEVDRLCFQFALSDG